jgi:hypothetical protein
MDDYSVHSLIESKNEWCARLMNILTPLVISGFNSIWKDAFQIATKNGEKGKYLMTFQNYLSQVPKWSQTIVQAECERIITKSSCNYLQDLLTCVHIIQLKALSCIRVGQSQRKVDIDIPSLETFIHNIYINCARKVYTNAYLFETDIPSLQIQKNNRELELIIRECIVNTVRDSVPTEKILRAYMDEGEEVDVETKEEVLNVDDGEANDEESNNAENDDTSGGDATQQGGASEEPTKKEETSSAITAAELASAINVDTSGTETGTTAELVIEKATHKTASENSAEKTSEQTSTSSSTTVIKKEDEDIEVPRSLSFNDKDQAMTPSGAVETIDAPKTIERLEQLSAEGFAKRKAEEEEDDEEEKLNIGGDVMFELDDIVSLEPKF